MRKILFLLAIISFVLFGCRAKRKCLDCPKWSVAPAGESVKKS